MFYRAWQFFRALLARIHPHEGELVAQQLGPSLEKLFWQMDRCDQRHGLDVFYTLREAGHPCWFIGLKVYGKCSVEEVPDKPLYTEVHEVWESDGWNYHGYPWPVTGVCEY